jgi:hypothetical protein
MIKQDWLELVGENISFLLKWIVIYIYGRKYMKMI